MIDADVSLYLVSRPRLALLYKTVSFVAIPRVGEFVKLQHRGQSDYLAFTVVQVTHRENGAPELWLNLTSLTEGRNVIDFIEDEELDEYIASYQNEGWVLTSIKPNRTFRETGEPFWSLIAKAMRDRAETNVPPDRGR